MTQNKSLTALACGTFCLGISEFVMMGILPHIAHSMQISIPEAGHLISAYALGVCIGAPLIVLTARKRPLHQILLALMVIYIIGNLSMAICSHVYAGLFCRFISGLPHGAYFGVGSIVADRLAPKGKSTLAIAIMCSGMTVANLVGVPLGTWISETFTWRVVFILATLFGGTTWLFLYLWIPRLGSMPITGLKDQFRFLKKGAPWLIAAGTTFGNGGIFCWYSYISPQMNQVTGFTLSEIAMLMILAGASMCIGNLIGGKLSDRYSPGYTALGLQVLMFVGLLSIFLWANLPGIAVIMMCLCTACLFGVAAPQQLLLLRSSQGSELLGAAMVQMAFNLGNALGAYCGGLPITCGLPYNYTALVGCFFVVGGIGALVVFCKKYKTLNLQA